MRRVRDKLKGFLFKQDFHCRLGKPSRADIGALQPFEQDFPVFGRHADGERAFSRKKKSELPALRRSGK